MGLLHPTHEHVLPSSVKRCCIDEVIKEGRTAPSALSSLSGVVARVLDTGGRTSVRPIVALSLDDMLVK